MIYTALSVLFSSVRWVSNKSPALQLNIMHFNLNSTVLVTFRYKHSDVGNITRLVQRETGCSTSGMFLSQRLKVHMLPRTRNWLGMKSHRSCANLGVALAISTYPNQMMRHGMSFPLDNLADM